LAKFSRLATPQSLLKISDSVITLEKEQ
jgi:hypothetical protein